MSGSWWRVLTKWGPLEKGIANHFSILALRTSGVCLVTQLCPTVCDPMDCSPPTEDPRLFCTCGFSRQEYWSGLPSPPPGDLPNPRDQNEVSHIAGRFFTIWALREAHEYRSGQPMPSLGALPNPGFKPRSPTLQVDSLPSEPQWEPHEQYEKAERYDTERWTPQVGRCPIRYRRRVEK